MLGDLAHISPNPIVPLDSSAGSPSLSRRAKVP